MFQLTHLAGFGVGEPPPATVSYIGSTGNGTAGSSFTFNSHAIGAAASNRIVAVAVGMEDATSNYVSGVTIDGVAMDLANRTDTLNSSAIFSLPWPTGTTANIVVSVGVPTALRCVIGVFNVTASNPTADVTNINNDAADPISANLTVKNNSVTIGTSASYENAGAATWSGLTKQYDLSVEASFTSGSAMTTNTTGGAKSLSVDWGSTGTAMSIVTASWR